MKVTFTCVGDMDARAKVREGMRRARNLIGEPGRIKASTHLRYPNERLLRNARLIRRYYGSKLSQQQQAMLEQEINWNKLKKMSFSDRIRK